MTVPSGARAIAHKAYVYAYAMLESYHTMYEQAVDPNAPQYTGGFGSIRNYSTPASPENRDIVTPNNDTPYSWMWLDLRAEPWVFSVPEVPEDRYYVAQWIDLFTLNFAYVGVRSTGFEAGSYLFAGPRWNGEKPPGIDQVFRSESDIVLSLTRTQLNGLADVENVKSIQAQYRLQALSTFLHKPAPPALPPIPFPPYDKVKARSHDFIGYLNLLLGLCEPPYAGEVELREQFATIGIGSNLPWDAAKIDPALLAEIDAGVAGGQKEIDAALAVTFDSNGLFGSREFLKNDYVTRAVAAAKGLYGNSQEEAWYGGFVGDGSTLGVLHFPADQLPPAKFFWSFTLYTLPERLLFANAKNLYSIGDRTPGLQYGKDGSLDIYIGHTSPGADKESNWLPAPAAKYSLVGRVYGPQQTVLDKTWKLPALKPIA